jgi:hypothetical protein
MAAMTTNVTPRRNGPPERTTPADEVARLRAAVQTLSDLVIAHRIMDASTLHALLGDVLDAPAAAPPAPAATLVTPPASLLPAPAPAAPGRAETQPVPPVAKKPSPFAPTALDAAALAAALGPELPTLKAPGLLSRLFNRKKASPAAVAKVAASIEFTERMPKLPFGDRDGLYSDPQRATELSFPPPSSLKRPRAAASARPPATDNPQVARFCERCWRRLDSGGDCRVCSAG